MPPVMSAVTAARPSLVTAIALIGPPCAPVIGPSGFFAAIGAGSGGGFCSVEDPEPQAAISRTNRRMSDQKRTLEVEKSARYDAEKSAATMALVFSITCVVLDVSLSMNNSRAWSFPGEMC